MVVSGVDPSDEDITNPIPRTAWARDVRLPELPVGQSLEVTQAHPRDGSGLPVATGGPDAQWWKRWLAWLTGAHRRALVLAGDMRRRAQAYSPTASSSTTNAPAGGSTSREVARRRARHDG